MGFGARVHFVLILRVQSPLWHLSNEENIVREQHSRFSVEGTFLIQLHMTRISAIGCEISKYWFELLFDVSKELPMG